MDELEERTFQTVLRQDLPEDVKQLIRDLWKALCEEEEMKIYYRDKISSS